MMLDQKGVTTNKSHYSHQLQEMLHHRSMDALWFQDPENPPAILLLNHPNIVLAKHQLVKRTLIFDVLVAGEITSY